MSKGRGNLQTLTAIGTTDVVIFVGPVVFHAAGAFGGSTVQLESNDPLDEFRPVSDTVSTTQASIFLPYAEDEVNTFRTRMTGGAAQDVDIWIQGRLLGNQ